VQKTQALILGAVVVIVLIIAVGYFKFSQSSKTTPVAPIQESTQNQGSTKGSIMSLLSAGNSVTCKTSYPDGAMSGTVYVADKKVRGDFMAEAGGKQMESHMIQDGDYGYFWSGNQGTKIKTDESSQVSPAPDVQTSAPDLNKDVDLDCSSWPVDASKFEVPADVKFTDLTEMMMQIQKTPTPSGTTNNSQSSYCDQITDSAAKAACMKAAGSQ